MLQFNQKIRMIKKTYFQKLIYFVPKNIRNKIRHIPVLAWMQRLFFRLFSPKEEFTHKIDAGPAQGLTILIKLPQDKEMWKGTYELDFCKKIVGEVRKSDICYDIGAFHGYISGIFAKAGARKVLAFEPLPENQKIIRQVIKMNDTLPIQLEPKAVSNTEGTQELQIHDDQSMNQMCLGTGLLNKNKIKITTTTVDATAKKIGMWPDILKIDVEGAEKLVLLGSVAALQKTVRLVFMEIHNSEAEVECKRMLENSGFICQWHEKPWGQYANQTMFVKK